MTRLVPALVLLCCLLAGPGHCAILRVAGPGLAESLPLLAMASGKAGADHGVEVRFTPWRTPDQLRALLAGGQADGAVITTAAACVLRKRGLAARVGMLLESSIWVLSSAPGPATPESLRGKLIFPFGPGEMPELLFRSVCRERGRELDILHAGNALEAVNLLLLGRGENALLSEPSATLALAKAEARGAALHRRLDMGRLWRETFEGRRLLGACIAFFGPAAGDHASMAAFARGYAEACGWVAAHREESLDTARSVLPSLAAHLEGMDWSRTAPRPATGPGAVDDALFFLSRIMEQSPKAVGGALPPREFFLGEP